MLPPRRGSPIDPWLWQTSFSTPASPHLGVRKEPYLSKEDRKVGYTVFFLPTLLLIRVSAVLALRFLGPELANVPTTAVNSKLIHSFTSFFRGTLPTCADFWYSFGVEYLPDSSSDF